MSMSLLDLHSAILRKAPLLRWIHWYRTNKIVSTCNKSLCSWQSAHAVRQAVNSRPTDHQQRRSDGLKNKGCLLLRPLRRYCVTVRWCRLNVDAGWRHRWPECSTRSSTLELCCPDTGAPWQPALIRRSDRYLLSFSVLASLVGWQDEHPGHK